MAFHVGQKVVYVGSDVLAANAYSGEIMPTKNTVYTVRHIEVLRDRQWLWLAEITNAPQDYEFGFRETGFAAVMFRPAVTRSTDTGVAILRKVAADMSSKVNA